MEDSERFWCLIVLLRHIFVLNETLCCVSVYLKGVCDASVSFICDT